MKLKLISSAIIASLPFLSVATVNPNATQDTKDIYNYIKDLPSGNENRVLSGAFGGYSGITDANQFGLVESNNISAATGGLKPAIYACDYARGWDTASNIADLIDFGCNTTLKDLANNQGGLVQISNHLPSPVPANGGGLNDTITNWEYGRILEDGHAIRNRWLQILDKVAAGLQDLENAGVTVIYRPLHEMNGEWFWWGNPSYQQDDATRRQLYKDLWIDMFNYFTYTKGLNNLIWVFSPDANRNFKSSYYPGDAYVDIVGLDAYTATAYDSNIASGYNELIGLNKPFAFAEIGPSQGAQGNYDYKQFIEAIRNNYPQTTYFIPWNNVWSPTNNQNAWDLFNNSWTINLGEVDVSGSGGGTGGGTGTSVQHNFESGTEGWLGEGVDGGPWSVSEWSANGSASLKAGVTLSANSTHTLKLTADKNLSSESGKTFKVRVSTASWGNWNGGEARLFIKSGNAWEWADSGWQSVNSGTTTLSLPAANVSTLSNVKEYGVEFRAGSNASGNSAIYIDYLTTE